MPEHVVVTFDAFALTIAAARKGLSQGLRETGIAVQQRAQYNIVEQHAVDTSALLNSLYSEGGDEKGDTRAEAVSKAIAAAATPGRKSGRTHGAPQGAPASRGSKYRVRVACAMAYAVCIELGTSRAHERPFMLPAFNDVKPKAPGVCSLYIAERMREVTKGGS